SLTLGGLAVLGAAAMLACGPDTFEIPIETPIQPKLDVAPFQRVLVAGFVAGGSEDVDTNQETVRLLRSQLRNKSSLKVIDADVMALMEVAQDQHRSVSAPEAAGNDEGGAPAAASGGSPAGGGSDRANQPLPLPER